MKNFSVTPVNMIVDGEQVFTQLHAQAEVLDADFEPSINKSPNLV